MMGIWDKLIKLINITVTDSIKGAVLSQDGVCKEFNIEKSVRQGDVLFTILFNVPSSRRNC